MRLALLLLTTALALVVACGPPASTLPVLGDAPEFRLIDQQGRPFSSTDLRDKVAVVNFVFTSCTDVCPLLSGTMASVRDRLGQDGLLGGKTQLVSLSVDPEHDTPEALTTYAERFGADPASWRFLTGDRPQIESLLITGYKVGAPPPAAATAGGQPTILHSSRFVLVDPRGKIRWYARGEELDVSQLVEEVRRLVG